MKTQTQKEINEIWKASWTIFGMIVFVFVIFLINSYNHEKRLDVIESELKPNCHNETSFYQYEDNGVDIVWVEKARFRGTLDENYENPYLNKENYYKIEVREVCE